MVAYVWLCAGIWSLRGCSTSKHSTVFELYLACIGLIDRVTSHGTFCELDSLNLAFALRPTTTLLKRNLFSSSPNTLFTSTCKITKHQSLLHCIDRANYLAGPLLVYSVQIQSFVVTNETLLPLNDYRSWIIAEFFINTYGSCLLPQTETSTDSVFLKYSTNVGYIYTRYARLSNQFVRNTTLLIIRVSLCDINTQVL